MSPQRPCPRCGRSNLGTDAFCSGCGEGLASPLKRHGWKLLFGVFAITVGTVWDVAIYFEDFNGFYDKCYYCSRTRP